jgi:hypothetical protein
MQKQLCQHLSTVFGKCELAADGGSLAVTVDANTATVQLPSYKVGALVVSAFLPADVAAIAMFWGRRLRCYLFAATFVLFPSLLLFLSFLLLPPFLLLVLLALFGGWIPICPAVPFGVGVDSSATVVKCAATESLKVVAEILTSAILLDLVV